MPRSAYNKGSRKALAAMRKKYGKKRGTSIFYAKSNKFGKKGKSRASKANSVYGKGKHTVKRSRKRRSSRRKKR